MAKAAKQPFTTALNQESSVDIASINKNLSAGESGLQLYKTAEGYLNLQKGKVHIHLRRIGLTDQEVYAQFNRNHQVGLSRAHQTPSAERTVSMGQPTVGTGQTTPVSQSAPVGSKSADTGAKTGDVNQAPPKPKLAPPPQNKPKIRGPRR